MKTFNIAFLLYAMLLFANSLVAGDLSSDELPGEVLRTEKFLITDKGEINAGSMANFAGAILSRDESIAMPYLFKAVAGNPDSAILMRYLTDRIKASKNRKIYQAQLEKLSARHPSQIRLALSTILMLISDGQRDKAMKLAEKSFSIVSNSIITPDQEPLFISLIRLVGAFRLQKKDLPGAVKLYDQILDKPELKDSPQLLEAAAVIYNRAAKKADNENFLWFNSDRENLEEQRDDCVARLEDISMEKYDPVALNALFAVFNSLKMNKRAHQVILQRLIYEPDNKLLRKMLALGFFKEREFQLSYYTWQNMAAEKLLEPIDFLMYGEAAWKAKKLKTARITFVRYMSKYPKKIQARLMLAMVLYDSGENVKTWNLLRTMPNSTVVLHLRSMVLIRQKKYANALAILKIIEKIYLTRKVPPTANLYLSMSYLAEKTGKIELFEQCILKLYKIAPERKAEWDNSIGYVLADNNSKLVYAEKMIRSAIKIKRKPEYLDSLAWVLYRQKKYPEAKKYIKEAVTAQHDVPDAVIADHAGDIYLALGNKTNALKFWRLSLLIYDNELDHSKINKKIAKLEKKD